MVGLWTCNDVWLGREWWPEMVGRRCADVNSRACSVSMERWVGEVSRGLGKVAGGLVWPEMA